MMQPGDPRLKCPHCTYVFGPYNAAWYSVKSTHWNACLKRPKDAPLLPDDELPAKDWLPNKPLAKPVYRKGEHRIQRMKEITAANKLSKAESILRAQAAAKVAAIKRREVKRRRAEAREARSVAEAAATKKRKDEERIIRQLAEGKHLGSYQFGADVPDPLFIAPQEPTPEIVLKDPQTQALWEALRYKDKYEKLSTYFPSYGRYQRAHYKKHLLFFAAGRKYRQRMFLAANRIGKTVAAGTEVVYHLTGLYPKWWVGKRFKHPQEWWVCGKTSKTITDILQKELLGIVGDFGTGLIPRHLIDFTTMTDAKKADTFITDLKIRHVSGGHSVLGFRSYDQGRQGFEGTKKSIWMDEEAPVDIYLECLTRTTTPTDFGEEQILLMSFTPLQGMTPLIEQFLGSDVDWAQDGEKGYGKFLVRATWDDVPHLSEKTKEELMGSYPEYQRDARSKGIPQFGEGAVYPFAITKVFVEPFQIPEHWKRSAAIDFGWDPDPTAVLWGATDPETRCTYIYAEHCMKQTEVMIHASIIKNMDKSVGYAIPLVCDPSGGGTSTADGKNTRDLYRKEYDVQMRNAINSVEPGIAVVSDLIVQDRLKIFNNCVQTRKEFGSYSRNAKGKPIGADHLMDCLRYLSMSGIKLGKSVLEAKIEKINSQKTTDGYIDRLVMERLRTPDWWMCQ